jgi:hypothetical protein
MPDPSTLGPEFEHLIDVLELVAQSSGGYVSYDSTVRGRRTGNISRIDAAVYIPAANEREELYVVECFEGPRAAGVGVVEDTWEKAQNTSAVRALAVSSSGFGRPARRRATELEVALVTLDDPTTIEWPTWITNRSFTTGDLQWRITGVTLPPAPGIPGSAFRPEVGRNDALFENPTGRQFTADRLFQRWLKIEGNEDALNEEADRAEGAVRKKSVLLAFDRPMKLLGTTVRRLPAVSAANVEIEFWLNRRVIPVSLMVAPSPEDPWGAEVALVSGAVQHEGEVKRVVMALDIDEETGERKVIAEVLGQSPQRRSGQGTDDEGEEDETPGESDEDGADAP